jgi:hypothetical protein
VRREDQQPVGDEQPMQLVEHDAVLLVAEHVDDVVRRDDGIE